MYWQLEKTCYTAINRTISSTSPQYGELQPTNGWHLWVSLGHPSKFQPVSRLGFITAPTSLSRGWQNFAGCLAVSWAGTLYIHFWGLYPLTEFFQVQNSLCVQVLRSPIFDSVNARHSISGRQWNFVAWYKEWNYGTFADGDTYIRLGCHYV